jgi:catechol 2,3-dioxygenase-like lactoylglutathione lyase family enzyme
MAPRSSRDIIVRSPDLGKAQRFYREILGFETTLEKDDLLGFETGSFQLFVERGTPAHAAVFELFVDDVEAAKKRLLAEGCTVVEEDPTFPRCYVRDPFGFVFNVARRSGA